MKAELQDKPWFNTPTMHPFWMGVIGFLVNLFGLFFLGWKLETVVWLLWFEVIFIVHFASCIYCGRRPGWRLELETPRQQQPAIFNGVENCWWEQL